MESSVEKSRGRGARTARTLSRAALALSVTAGTLRAQGSVSGQVSLQERPGEQSADLANAVIYLEPLAPARPRLAPTAGAQISMLGRQFAPRVAVVTAGSRVSFPNRDPFSHNIFSNTAGAAFDLGLYPKGESKDAEFRRPGVYPVYCNIHARMTGYVLALGTPHHAQAGVDGRWTIAGVPAGRYVAHFWHDRAPEQTRELTVPREGLAGVNAPLDARGYRVVAHRNKFGQEYQRGRDRY
jgi:plastocyanin